MEWRRLLFKDYVFSPGRIRNFFPKEQARKTPRISDELLILACPKNQLTYLGVDYVSSTVLVFCVFSLPMI